MCSVLLVKSLLDSFQTSFTKVCLYNPNSSEQKKTRCLSAIVSWSPLKTHFRCRLDDITVKVKIWQTLACLCRPVSSGTKKTSRVCWVLWFETPSRHHLTWSWRFKHWQSCPSVCTPGTWEGQKACHVCWALRVRATSWSFLDVAWPEVEGQSLDKLSSGSVAQISQGLRWRA